jgi:transglutaminase-like putative cysteine protease
LTVSASAQFQQADAAVAEHDEIAVERWRIGLIVTAGSGPCQGIVATTSVPTDWPEQQVRVVEEDISPGVRVTQQMIEGAVQQLTARIRSLSPGEQARAVVTFEVKRIGRSAPEETERYVLPSTRRSDRKMQACLSPSPYIESADPQIQALAEKVGADEQRAWNRVEAIYDWVRESIELEDNRGSCVKTTLETLRDGTGDCDELTSLFIAICRAGGIPARTVRVPGHCYPEFYLDDGEGKGHWFSCDPTTANALGELAEHRPVLQKGDKLLLRDPQTKRTKSYRFLPDNLIIANLRGSAPELELILERAGD